MNGEVRDALIASGIKTVACGHQPFGDGKNRIKASKVHFMMFQHRFVFLLLRSPSHYR